MAEAGSRCTVAGTYRAPSPARDDASGGFAALLRGLAERRERTRAIRALNRLGDRHLLDLGIARADIETIVDGLMHRRRR